MFLVIKSVRGNSTTLSRVQVWADPLQDFIELSYGFGTDRICGGMRADVMQTDCDPALVEQLLVVTGLHIGVQKLVCREWWLSIFHRANLVKMGQVCPQAKNGCQQGGPKFAQVG
ncbi:MAG: hypothetical protein R2838_07835 [Caldilineaceae bacterium]